jgi:hypothetical protein
MMNRLKMNLLDYYNIISSLIFKRKKLFFIRFITDFLSNMFQSYYNIPKIKKF